MEELLLLASDIVEVWFEDMILLKVFREAIVKYEKVVFCC